MLLENHWNFHGRKPTFDELVELHIEHCEFMIDTETNWFKKSEDKELEKVREQSLKYWKGRLNKLSKLRKNYKQISIFEI